MNYVDKDALLDYLLSEHQVSAREMMASVDKSQLEQDIRKDEEAAFQPFLCTYELRVEPDSGITPNDQDLIEEIYPLVQGSKVEARRGLKKLEKLKAKYPNVPMLYNFTSVAYQTLKQDKKNYHILKVTHKKFPNYVFGKISLADHRISHGHHEEVPAIFDQKLQLYMHYPDEGKIPTFHGSEILGFYTVMGRYYARSRQIACAIKCYFLVEETNNNSQHLKVLAKEIVIAEIALLMGSSLGKLGDSREETIPYA